MGDFVKILSPTETKGLDLVDQIVKVVSVRIKTQSALENFRVDVLRILFPVCGNLNSILNTRGENFAYIYFPKLLFKKIETILRRYSYENSPIYFKLFKSEDFEKIKISILEFLNSLDRKFVFSMIRDTEKKKELVDNLILYLKNKEFIK